MTDASTFAAVAALAVAVVALLVGFAQALQQYLVSGQLVRICDSVVYGKLPGQGHRLWQFSQFRFRVVYSIPQITLSPNLWIGILSKARAVDIASSPLPSLKVSESNTKGTSIAGEASWVSFTRAIQHTCGHSLRYKMVEGDADRCPSDLPVVPMQLSMRDVVVVATMAGMDCTDVSFQSQSLSMQGDAGTITSSRHPVLGALIHFAPKDAFENHGISVNNGTVNADWVARMVDIVTVAGCRLDSHDRVHFEEDESSWIRSANYEGPVRSQRPPTLPTYSSLRERRRRSSSHDEPDPARFSYSAYRGEQRSNDFVASAFITSAALRRPQDGEWSIGRADSTKPLKSPGATPNPRIPRATQRYSRKRTTMFNSLRRTTQGASSNHSASILPVSVSKEKDPPSSTRLAVGGACPDGQSGEQVVTNTVAGTKAGPPFGTHQRQGNLAADIAASRHRQIGVNEKTQRTDQLLLLESDALGQSAESTEQKPEEYSDHQSNNLNSARNEYVTNKWQEIIQQRRKDRSRGRSQGARAVPAKLGEAGRRSSTRTRPSRKLGRHQLQLRDDPCSTSAASDDTAESDSESKEQSRIGSEARRQSVDGMPKYDPSKSDTSPTRGRRRNSSLIRERTSAQIVAYGSQPIPSYSPSSTAEQHRSSAPEDSNSIISQRSDQTTTLAPQEGPYSLGDHSAINASPRPGKSSSSANTKPKRKVRVLSPTPSADVDSRVHSPSSPRHETQGAKGILRRPTEHFPEHPQPFREGVAPLGPVKREIPRNARWTKIDRRLVNPEALEHANERFEERQDYVIVLRVLTKEEIEQYVLITARLRGKMCIFFFSSCVFINPLGDGKLRIGFAKTIIWTTIDARSRTIRGNCKIVEQKRSAMRWLGTGYLTSWSSYLLHTSIPALICAETPIARGIGHLRSCLSSAFLVYLLSLAPHVVVGALGYS